MIISENMFNELFSLLADTSLAEHLLSTLGRGELWLTFSVMGMLQKNVYYKLANWIPIGHHLSLGESGIISSWSSTSSCSMCASILFASIRNMGSLDLGIINIFQYSIIYIYIPGYIYIYIYKYIYIYIYYLPQRVIVFLWRWWCPGINGCIILILYSDICQHCCWKKTKCTCRYIYFCGSLMRWFIIYILYKYIYIYIIIYLKGLSYFCEGGDVLGLMGVSY